MKRFAGKIAIVTGASRGIGRAIAKRLASEGATVVAVARGDNARGTVDEIAAEGGKAEVASADMTDTASLEQLIAGVLERHGRIDVLVSNPPYVAESDRSTLPVDVVDHEPHHALFAGSDGLAVLVRLVVESKAWLRKGGWLVCEIGQGQSQVVPALLRRRGYAEVDVHPDLSGRDRVVVGQWYEPPS
jgi:HemK-like putative methylase